MSGRFRLQFIRVRAFRGAREEVHIPLEKPLNVIFGPNGSGKSTLTTAIEWALFPQQSQKQTQHNIDERRDWEIQHLYGDNPAHVHLELVKNGQPSHIRREGTKVTKTEPAYVQCNYGDFKNLVYVHQETLRDFLVGPPGERKEAFQRLLAAGWAQDLAQAISKAQKKLKDRCKAADEAVQKQDELLDARLQEARRQLDGAESEARETGMRPPWEKAAKKEAEKINREVEEICGRADISRPACPNPTPLATYLTRLRVVLHPIRSVEPSRKWAELGTQIAQLEAAKAAFSAADQGARETVRKLRDAQKSLGNKQALDNKLADLEARRCQAEESLSSLDRKRAVIHAAAQYLEEQPSVGKCPVCASTVRPRELLAELRSVLGDSLSKEEQRLQQDVQALRAQIDVVRESIDTLANLNRTADTAERAALEKRQELEDALGRKFREDEDPKSVAQHKLTAMRHQLSEFEKAVTAHHESLNDLEERAKSVDRVAQVLILQERIQWLEEVRDSPEWSQMLEARNSLAKWELLLKHAANAVTNLAAQLARRNLERSIGVISSVYRRLTQRADFPEIDIDAQEKYEVSVKGESYQYPITGVLNLTDLNAVAIAVVLGMAASFPEAHDLDFVILDDPSQGMDREVTARLAELISEVSENVQVVVSTPDERLLQALEQSARRKNIIRLRPRDPETSEPSIGIEQVPGA